MHIKPCKQCGKPFEASTKRNKVCSGACYRASENAYSKRRYAMFSPDRKRAANLVQTAILGKRLVPQPCEQCGYRYTVAHHDDYAAPLAVRWLCRSCHKKHHAEFGPGLNAYA